VPKFEYQNATSDLPPLYSASAVWEDEILVEFNNSGGLLVLPRNERYDATLIALGVRGQPFRFVVIATAHQHPVTHLQHWHTGDCDTGTSPAPEFGNDA